MPTSFCSTGILFLSTPSARRATLREPEHHEGLDISIHALREEGDAAIAARRPPSNDFYPRPPRGGRPTTVQNATNVFVFLSTPSARRATTGTALHGHFRIFLSTPSARRATVIRAPLPPKLVISIHALREEGDDPRGAVPTLVENFYPRPPRGGRRAMPFFVKTDSLFLSTPSARRAT